ncbi:MAG: asparaginase [Comamonadaceae bacterium]|nr:MAG: asparaginase [Comamonadaceae bacterium]
MLSMKRLVVLGTGGTISGEAASAADNLGYSAGSVTIGRIVEEIAPPPGHVLVPQDVAQLDSKDMDFQTWQALAGICQQWLEQPDVVGVVITHGTDTLEETAYFLDQVLPPGKPLVLTCAMRPASSLAPDGPQNVRDALALAATPHASGVMVVCAGVVHAAVDAQKVHTYRLDAFSSGDVGPIGFIEEGGLRQARSWATTRFSPELARAVLATPPEAWPRIDVVTSHAGARSDIVDALLGARERGLMRLDGLVVAATGNGTLHRSLELGLRRAEAAGVVVRRATRCSQGRILAAPGEAFEEAGALSPVKARIRLLLDLLERQTGARHDRAPTGGSAAGTPPQPAS